MVTTVWYVIGFLEIDSFYLRALEHCACVTLCLNRNALKHGLRVHKMA